MRIFQTIKAKIFLLLVFIAFLPIVLHLLVLLLHTKSGSSEGFFNVTELHLFLENKYLWTELVLTLIFAVVFTIYLAKRLKRVVKITHKVSSLIDMEENQSFYKDEIDQLENTVNNMILQIKKDQQMLGEILNKRSKDLINSEKKHRELLNIFADVIYELNAGFRIVNAKHVEEVFGYKEKEVIGKKCLDFVHVEDRGLLEDALQKTKKSENKNLKDFKLRMLTKKGEIRYILFSCRFLYKNNEFKRLEAILRDITPREELAQKIISEKETLEQTYQNLHKSYLALGKINAQVAALAEINMTFSSNLSWKDKLHYIIESIKTFMQANETLLFIQDSKAKNYLLVNASVDFDFWSDISLKGNHKIIKEAIRFRKPLKYLNPAEIINADHINAKGYQAMLVIPVIINNEILGLFILFFNNQQVIEEIQTKLTLAYTSQMAVALMMSGELDHSLKKIF